MSSLLLLFDFSTFHLTRPAELASVVGSSMETQLSEFCSGVERTRNGRIKERTDN